MTRHMITIVTSSTVIVRYLHTLRHLRIKIIITIFISPQLIYDVIEYNIYVILLFRHHRGDGQQSYDGRSDGSSRPRQSRGLSDYDQQ